MTGSSTVMPATAAMIDSSRSRCATSWYGCRPGFSSHSPATSAPNSVSDESRTSLNAWSSSRLALTSATTLRSAATRASEAGVAIRASRLGATARGRTVRGRPAGVESSSASAMRRAVGTPIDPTPAPSWPPAGCQRAPYAGASDRTIGRSYPHEGDRRAVRSSDAACAERLRPRWPPAPPRADTRQVSGFDARVTAFSFRRQRLDGSAGDALDAVRAVVGVYSAMPGGALSIRVRAAGIGPDDVRDLERGRLVVRMRAMRTSAFIVPLTTAGLVAAATAVPLARFRWLVRAAGISDEGVPAVRAAVLAACGEPGTVPKIRVRLADAGHDAATSPWTQGEALGRVLSLLTASGDVAAIGQESLSSNALRYVDR